MKRLLVTMRKTATPQRDAFASLMGGVVDLPGLAEEDERYFRDIYDHLIRISDLIDSYRDLLTGAMDVYLSTVSNRLNSVMKQLFQALIAMTRMTESRRCADHSAVGSKDWSGSTVALTGTWSD